jgi:alcohol dehydrogenase class IV
MLDALCQAIESWWSVHSTDESKTYSRKAIELIMANWQPYIFDADEQAAANIMLAANYGGRAINITATTAAHAMSYKITSLYRLPHGHAVAVGLPEIWQYMLAHTADCIDPRGEAYLQQVFADIATAMGCQSAAEAIALFRQLMSRMDMQNPVSTDFDRELTILSTSVNPIRLRNNPVSLDLAAITGLYQTIIHA